MAGEDEVDGLTAGVTPSSSTAAAATAPRRPQHAGTVYRPSSRFSFPRAAQPEIVRAYQKDVYYRDMLRDQLQDVARSVLGSRTLFAHAETISFLGSVAYFTLSTLGGAQTLGEEYVNAMMTDGKTGRIVALRRRIAFIFFHVVSPYLLSRVYGASRRRIVASHQQRSQALQRARLRAAAVAPRRGPEAEKAKAREPQPSRLDRLVGILAERLPSMESFNASDGWLAYASAAHLALFYLGSRYYAFGQRMAGVEYISTIARRPGSKPPSYEVLGFLLGLQLVIKMLLGANRWRVARSKAKKEKLMSEGKWEEKREAEREQDEKEVVHLDDVAWTHKTQPPTRTESGTREEDHGRVPLSYADPDALSSAAELGLDKGASREQLEASRGAARVKAAELEAVAESVLKCTLCMEKREPEKGTSAVTECGHVFCWDCIVGWAREKPECPLCRQSLNPSHILPIYNF